MPYKDREQQLASQRRHYARHREQVIAKVAHRKRTLYAGVCRSCGGPTMGSTKGDIPEWCSKPECASRQRKEGWSEQRRARIKKSLKEWNV